ncbi:hypothetical protein [Streptomyces lavendulae]|uniref:hypothetical protein n=1 Tax=Streptomyces lavendulae TaxID=1914 RepID=UPI0025532F8B|nr:hypothetical protein [Streptomyces lavendulae]
MLLGAVLWCQGVWGYSALLTGLAIAPGPLLVPPVALRIGPAVARFGAGRIALAGTVVFAAGILWWAATLDTGPSYATSLLPGMMLTGLGVPGPRTRCRAFRHGWYAVAAASLLGACATVPLTRKPRPGAAESPDTAGAAKVGAA